MRGAALTTVVLALVVMKPAPAELRAEQMACAAMNDSTAPSYVWLQVTAEDSGDQWSVVVEAPEVPDDAVDAGFRIKVPSAARGRAFRPDYGGRLLESAREHLARFTDAELTAQFDPKARERGPATEFSGPEFWPAQRALAHALFERGFFPLRGDYVPALYAVQTPCTDLQEW
jgi:hypothetical protein